MQLFQGEGYANFKEHSRESSDGVRRCVVSQTELIAFNLETELKLSSLRSRRQAISYLLEQCVMLCEGSPMQEHERRRMRRVSRLVSRARKTVRREK